MAMPNFVGRTNELKQIQSCWANVCQGQPQVINLIADTGVGKTRLVQAFYEWLSTAPEQGGGIGNQGYWPDELGVGRQRVVNPPLEDFAEFDLKEKRIPWLWWGMYWTDADGENDCALSRFQGALEAHLQMLELERRFKLNTLSAIGDFVRDEGLNQVAELIPGGSQVVNVYSLAKKIVASRKGQQEKRKGLGGQSQHQQEALANDIIERLQVVFNPKKKDVPRVPMVLFLDDIHFATDISGDGFTLQFLDRLVRQAALEQWPLLIISTHWKGPWQAHRQGVTLAEGKPWRRVVSELEAEPGTAALGIHALELTGIPTGDLRRIIIDLQPGLNRENQESILARVDNVRWLVEVLHALGDNIENFESNDRQNPLSAHGQRRLDELLKSRGYLEVIRQRLEGDSMVKVRAVLGATAWHAYGLEFLSPLAGAFGPGLIEQGSLRDADGEPAQQVLDSLMRALDPAALLEGQSQNNGLPSLVRFPERGYLQTAKDLFDPDRLPGLSLALGREIINWMRQQEGALPLWQQLASAKDKRAFLEIAQVVLGQLHPQLSEDQQAELTATEKSLRRRLEKGKISEEELQEELQEAKQELLEEASGPQLPEATHWQIVAMVELVAMLEAEGEGRAFSLAYELAGYPQLPTVLPDLKLKVVLPLCDLWEEKTECWALSRSVLESLARLIQSEVEQESTAERLKDLDNVVLSLAGLNYQSADFDQARMGYQRSLEIGERLMSEFGETPDRLQRLTISLDRLAELDHEAGKFEQARTGYQRCLEIIEGVIATYGETPDRLVNLSISMERLADQDRDTGEFDQARAGYQRVFALCERLLSEFGETPQRLRHLAVAQERLADMDLEAGEIDKARVGHRHSLEIDERLVTDFGETPDRLRSIAISLLHLASLDLEAGEIEQARSGYQRSLEISERLLDEFGETSERLQDLIFTQWRLADLDRDVGEVDQARTGYQRCLEISERQLSEYGETAERLEELADSVERIATLDLEAGMAEQARSGYECCFEIREHLLAEFGETPGRLEGLAEPVKRLADLNLEAGNVKQALAGYERSLDIQKRLNAMLQEAVDAQH